MSDQTSRDKLQEIEAARTSVMDEGRPDAVAKRRAQGMATARERIEQFVDRDSFREVGALVEPDRSNELNRDLVAPADGVITGTGKVAGREVSIIAQDFTVYGGSIGTAADLKAGRLVQRGLERGLPMVMKIGRAHV